MSFAIKERSNRELGHNEMKIQEILCKKILFQYLHWKFFKKEDKNNSYYRFIKISNTLLGVSEVIGIDCGL